MRQPTYARVLALTLIAALVTACLGSTGLAAWTDALPDNSLCRAVAGAAHRLDSAMAALRITGLSARLHACMQAVEAGKFTGEPGQ